MKRKNLVKLAEDPRFISGIYNYCDRWCERCAFTSNCLLYAMDQEDDTDPEAHDIRNEAFWRKLHNIFEQTKEMILGWAEEQGIDLESVDVEEAMQQEERRRDEAEAHELSQAAQHYARRVTEWFNAERSLFPASSDEADTEWTLSDQDQASSEQADDIQDAVDVIHWYQYQIAVKIMRGLISSQDEEEPEAEMDWQKDSDGSIKVALIGMDRCIMAWGTLLKHFPDKTESIRPILFHLERLRRKTEQAFPNARKFARPGFDTTPSRFVN